MRLALLLLAGVAAAGPLTAGRTGEARAQLLRARGGSKATEDAVASALKWLAAHQGEDGSWDADGFGAACDCGGGGKGWHGEDAPCPFDREVTALAALAFLGAGHGHRDGPYKDTVSRALAWMQRGSGGTLFGAAYATQAFAEAFDLTGDEALKPAVEAGIREMLRARQKDGAWRYFPMEVSDVPTTTAVVVSLRVAEEAGFEVDRAYRQSALDMLDRLVDRKTGRVAYHWGAEQLGYTPTTANASSALLVRSWLDAMRTPEAALSLKAIADRRPKWSVKYKTMKVKGVEREVQIGNLDLYGWWHATEALARTGGPEWTAWNDALRRALLGHQRTNGHAAGSWDPEGTYGKVGGRVFSTALGALMLESYWRYP
ncbi:MAG TPA: hypothetical protein VFY93_16845 [Planctomycetota bacterium]|nr:hypothetical protein [Planctomycetota bacterium]